MPVVFGTAKGVQPGEDARHPLVGRIHARSHSAMGPGTTWKQAWGHG